MSESTKPPESPEPVEGITYPPTEHRLELIAATMGDIVHRRPNDFEHRLDPMWVMGRCRHLLVGYYCGTHRCDLSGLAALLEHIEAGGRHTIAVYCPEHRTFEAADQVQFDAIMRGAA